MDDLDKVLPEGVLRAQGPPNVPATFGPDYAPPAHTTKPLQEIHHHPLDAHLTFFEAPHVYVFRGVPLTLSVTGLAHEFERPFDAEAAIKSMKSSRREAWPRLKYVVGATRAAVSDLVPSKGVLVVCDGATVSALGAHSMEDVATGDGIYAVAQMARRDSGTSTADEELYTFDRVMTDEEIATSWNDAGRLASQQGTEGHHLCELFLNGLPCRWWDPEALILFEFLRRHVIPRGIVVHSTEKEIVCVDADLGGSIDAIFFDAEAGVYHIVDFKRSDKLAEDLVSSYRMKPPFSHLSDCRGAKYALQVSIYQFILERDYAMSIGDRVLVSIHPDAPCTTSVPYLRDEVEFLMRRRFTLVRARRAAAAADPRFRCSLTDAPVVDAVRLEDGRIVMEKAALVHDLPFVAEPSVREEFEAAVQSRVEDVDPIHPSACVAWRRRMPSDGLVPF